MNPQTFSAEPAIVLQERLNYDNNSTPESSHVQQAYLPLASQDIT
jgi:hypothetical protein